MSLTILISVIKIFLTKTKQISYIFFEKSMNRFYFRKIFFSFEFNGQHSYRQGQCCIRVVRVQTMVSV